MQVVLGATGTAGDGTAIRITRDELEQFVASHGSAGKTEEEVIREMVQVRHCGGHGGTILCASCACVF
jgi:hypothetical protein